MTPRTTMNNTNNVSPFSLNVCRSIIQRFLGFVLVVIVATAGKVVNAEDAGSDLKGSVYVWCPNELNDEWNGEQCQETMRFISKGPDEDYFELEDVSADPKFAEVIDDIQYPDPLSDLDNLVYATIGEQMERYSADSFLIYQNGQLIYEKYAKEGDKAFPDPFTGGENKTRAYDYTQNDRHALYSVTKSFMGMVFAKLLAEVDEFNEDDSVTRWLPGLENTSAFNTATVRMIADMSVDFQFEENAGPSLEQFVEFNTGVAWYIFYGEEGDFPLAMDFEQIVWSYLTDLMKPLDPEEPLIGNITGNEYVDAMPSKLEFIKLLQRGNSTLENGAKFGYRSVLTDVLALICSAVIQEAYFGEYGSVEDYFEKEIWAKLGTDQDLALVVNADGVPVWWSMASATARDLLRSGIMLLNDGKNHKGEQVLPIDAIDDIFDGSDLSRSQFAANTDSYLDLKSSGDVYSSSSSYFPDLEECAYMTSDWSYRDQFRSYNPEKGKGTGEIALFEGYFGQSVYVDRKADLVIVQQSVDRNYASTENLVWFGNQMSFHALSVYFRCNPQIGSGDEETTSGVPDRTATTTTTTTTTKGVSDGGSLSVRMYPLVFLYVVGFLLA